MKCLLSCLLLASNCALSSWSDATALQLSQSADINVLESQNVNISCCWTGNYPRVRVEWNKNKTTYKVYYYQFQICQPAQPRLASNQSRVYPAYCPKPAGIGSSTPANLVRNKRSRKWMDGQPALQKVSKTCVSLVWANITTEDSGHYVCQAKADIPTLMTGRGNGTVVTVTRQRSDGIAEEDKPGSPLWVPLGISLALVALLLLSALACIFKLRQRKRVSRVIYESPHLDSDDADMDKRSSGNSSAGSSQWCQVVVYESVDYFDRVEKKQSGYYI
ncbi:uncharacterized protein LOC144004280 [Festucalex cinctus]